MSVYRPRGSRLYVYDFWRGDRRFLGPTGKTSAREAHAVEAIKKRQAEQEIALARDGEAQLRGKRPLTLDIAAGQWWTERGQFRTDADDCWLATEAMIAHFGKDKRMDAITDADIAAWVAKVRGQTVWCKEAMADGSPAPLLSPARVNRLTIDTLRRIYGRARRAWKLVFANEPDWKEHRLEEPEEITRELGDGEQAALTAQAHPDYERLYRFARISGLRLAACLLRKSDVKWDVGRIEVLSKGGKLNRVPLTAALREILAECWDDHPEFVFTYRAHRTCDGKVKGKRYPITYSGLKSQWKRDKQHAIAQAPSLVDFRFHDNRHTAATRILRTTGNLKLAQRLLNHARISTTGKYAHVLEEEVRAGMEATPDTAVPAPKGDEKSRDESRGKGRGAA
jgi:hypothetical protein